MGLPWRALTAVSLVYAYCVTSKRAALGFIGNFLTASVLQFCGYVLWAVILYPKLFSPLRGLPEPSGNSWFMGQWHRVASENPGAPMLEWANTIPNDGLIRFLSICNQERLLPTSVSALREILVTKAYDFTKPGEFITGLGRILGIGLFLAEGDEHKRQRRTLLPAFAFRHLKDLVPTFWDMSRRSALLMEKSLGGAVTNDTSDEGTPSVPKAGFLEARDWASRITLDIIGVAGLGRDFGATEDPYNQLVKTYGLVTEPTPGARLLAVLQLLIPGWFVNLLPVERNSTVQKATAFVRNVCRELIAEKKQKLGNKTLDDLDILSVALESGGFTEDELVNQLMTFLGAGHETSAMAMTWTIYALCLHPEIQERLREEIRSRLPSLDDVSATVSALDIEHMPYLNAVCHESLRYYPPAPVSARVAAVDTTICGQRVPRGTRIMIVPFAINRSRALWGPDAGKFDPERWLPHFEGDKGAASGHADSNFAFLSFFHGPRSCIGQGFAKAEFACLLACWVGRFKFELKNEEDYDEDKLEVKGIITARPAKGLWVKATVVDGW